MSEKTTGSEKGWVTKHLYGRDAIERYHNPDKPKIPVNVELPNLYGMSEEALLGIESAEELKIREAREMLKRAEQVIESAEYIRGKAYQARMEHYGEKPREAPPPFPSFEEMYRNAREAQPDASEAEIRRMVGAVFAGMRSDTPAPSAVGVGSIRTFEKGKHSASGDSEKLVETTQPVGQTNYDIQAWHDVVGYPGQLPQPPEEGGS